MNAVLPAVSRRSALKSAAAAVLATSCSAWGHPGRTAGRAITVAQIFDSSNEQQDVARDFLIGSRAAWLDINSRGGLRGRPVLHSALEVDGTLPSLKATVQSLRDDPA